MSLLVSVNGFSQEKETETIDINSLSLEDILNMEITVATKKELTVRESPAIISVITEKDILNMGARDLLDVLNSVPGFYFTYDVYGVVALQTRGLFAHEGKVLLLWNGIEINELNYGTMPYSQRFDISQITRIEIIRGPGSSVFGGFAELGVINIITKTSDDTEGLRLSASGGMSGSLFSRKNISAYYGKKINDQIGFNASLFLQNAMQGTGSVTDSFEKKESYDDNADIQSVLFNSDLKIGELKITELFEKYSIRSKLMYLEIPPSPQDVHFIQNSIKGQYNYSFNESFSLTPQLSYLIHEPWRVNDDTIYQNRVQSYRFTGELGADYNINKDINLTFGAGFFNEGSENKLSVNSPFFGNYDKVKYNAAFGYTQLLIKSDWLTATIGGRIQNHNQYGTAFAPRIGLTKVFGKAHAKLLFNKSFRTPSLLNVKYNEFVKPENTTVAECEIGYQISDKIYMNVNLFDINIDMPIVYYVDESGNETVGNYKKTGSRGLETDFRLQDTWGNLIVNYSYYTLAGKNEVPAYAVPGKTNYSLGSPQHKISVQSNIKLSEQFYINPSVQYFSERYGIKILPAGEFGTAENYEGKTIINLVLQGQKIMGSSLNISAGVYDMLNDKMDIIQAYNAGSPALPVIGREFVMKLYYTLL